MTRVPRRAKQRAIRSKSAFRAAVRAAGAVRCGRAGVRLRGRGAAAIAADVRRHLRRLARTLRDDLGRARAGRGAIAGRDDADAARSRRQVSVGGDIGNSAAARFAPGASSRRCGAACRRTGGRSRRTTGTSSAIRAGHHRPGQRHLGATSPSYSTWTTLPSGSWHVHLMDCWFAAIAVPAMRPPQLPRERDGKFRPRRPSLRFRLATARNLSRHAERQMLAARMTSSHFQRPPQITPSSQRTRIRISNPPRPIYMTRPPLSSLR